MNLLAPTFQGCAFYFVTRLNSLHVYSFFRSTYNMTANNFKNQEEHYQHHNLKPDLSRQRSTTLDDQKMPKDYYSVKVPPCEGNQIVYIFQGSTGSLMIEERLRSISSNNIFEFSHTENYYYFSHFSSFLKIQFIF